MIMVFGELRKKPGISRALYFLAIKARCLVSEGIRAAGGNIGLLSEVVTGNSCPPDGLPAIQTGLCRLNKGLEMPIMPLFGAASQSAFRID